VHARLGIGGGVGARGGGGVGARGGGGAVGNVADGTLESDSRVGARGNEAGVDDGLSERAAEDGTATPLLPEKKRRKRLALRPTVAKRPKGITYSGTKTLLQKESLLFPEAHVQKCRDCERGVPLSDVQGSWLLLPPVDVLLLEQLLWRLWVGRVPLLEGSGGGGGLVLVLGSSSLWIRTAA
jgi:hypothetical protein